MSTIRTPLRVLHVIQNLHYGGMERILHALARRLPDHGCEVHIAALEYLGRFSEGLEGKATLHQVGWMTPLSLLHPAPLVNVIRRVRPDVVHSHSGVWLKAARAAHVARVPVVMHTEHGRTDPVPLRDRISDYVACQWTDMVIAVAEPLARILRAQVLPSRMPLRVIPNGVSQSTGRSASTRAATRAGLGLSPGRLVIGSVGRLEPVKNYALALHALATLPPGPAPGEEPVLVIAGDGSERPALEALAIALGISDRVMLLGWRDDANDLLAAYDIFFLSSLSEGTSVSLLEAMAAGTCPVVTDVGGNREVLGPLLESLLVESGNAAGLAHGWARLLADPTLREGLGSLAHDRAVAAYSIDAMVERLVATYRELLATARPAAPAPSTRKMEGDPE